MATTTPGKAIDAAYLLEQLKAFDSQVLKIKYNAKFQFSAMPVPEEKYIDVYVQYIGADTPAYISGYFYKGVKETDEETGAVTYKWEAVTQKAIAYTIEADDEESPDYAKVYHLCADGEPIEGSDINIPLDMVVSDGKVATYGDKVRYYDEDEVEVFPVDITDISEVVEEGVVYRLDDDYYKLLPDTPIATVVTILDKTKYEYNSVEIFVVPVPDATSIPTTEGYFLTQDDNKIYSVDADSNQTDITADVTITQVKINDKGEEVAPVEVQSVSDVLVVGTVYHVLDDDLYYMLISSLVPTKVTIVEVQPFPEDFPAGYGAGTYIVLTIANAEKKHLYIPISEMVNILKAGKGIELTEGTKAIQIKIAKEKSGLKFDADDAITVDFETEPIDFTEWED